LTSPAAGRTVLIADDHRLFAEGLAALLHDQHCHTIIVTVLDQLPATLDSARPDLLILDLAFGEESAMPLLRQLRTERPRLPILVITALEEVVIMERVRETGAAYLAKSRAGEDVAKLVEKLLTGRYVAPKPRSRRTTTPAFTIIGGVTLNRPQIETLRLLRLGHSNSEIAAAIGRSIKTVESHVTEMYARIGLKTRGHLIRWANQHARSLGGRLDAT
jgi:DNA-binding NarL/FixJ family response regulator